MSEFDFYWGMILLAFFWGAIPVAVFVRRATVRSRFQWLAFGVDALKGWVAVALTHEIWLSFLCRNLSEGRVCPGGSLEAPPEYFAWLAALAVVVGHCHFPWGQTRKLDKGLWVAFGAVLALSPLATGLTVVGAAVVYLIMDEKAWAGLASVLLFPTLYLVIEPASARMMIGLAISFLILLRHEVEIDVLLQKKPRED